MDHKLIKLVALLLVMASMPSNVTASVLWVIPENPTEWIASDPDTLLSETVVEQVNMGTTFSSHILVLNVASSGNPAADATEVDIKFFVNDASDIKDITIGTAKGIQPLICPFPFIIDENRDSNKSIQTLTFSAVPADPPVAAGYGVSYRIGTIPFSGGPSQHGNPEPDSEDGAFDPGLADYYVKVPFTVEFYNVPSPGFVLYVYAENQLAGQLSAKTAYSHDGGYNNIPEFPTIALPMLSILGLMFIMSRKRK